MRLRHVATSPKVILVNPSAKTVGYSFITPRWLFVIASATPSDLVGDPIIIDETIKKFKASIVRPGDIVGIGITTNNCRRGYQVAQEARTAGAIVIMGGVHASFSPDEARDHGAHAVVTGNGDIVWAQAVRDALNKNLKLEYKGGRVPGDRLLPARWDLLDPDKYMFPSIQTVVGCQENCSHCSVWIQDGRDPRQRLTDNIIAEVNQLYAMGYRGVIFADDQFTPSTLGRIARTEPRRQEEFRKIRAERLAFFDEYDKRVPKDMYAFTQMTSEIISDPEYLKAVRDKARVRAALLGIESVSEEGLRDVNKTWNQVGNDIAKIIQLLQENGIMVLSSIICGLASDTPESLARMRELVKKSGTYFAQFVPLYPLPGTVDTANMTADFRAASLSAATASSGLINSTPRKEKHKVKLLEEKYWLKNGSSIDIVIEHPTMSADVLRHEVYKSWQDFYSTQEIIKRMSPSWPLIGKIYYLLASRGFKGLYVGTGAATDSAREKPIPITTKLLMKGAIWFYNKFSHRKAKPRRAWFL